VGNAEIGRRALTLHAGRNRPHMNGRFAVEALIDITAAVDADVETGCFQCPVADPLPQQTDRLDFARAVAKAVELAGLRTKPIRTEPPRRHQQMRMIIAVVAMPVRRMHRQVDDEAMRNDGLPPYIARDLSPAEVRRANGEAFKEIFGPVMDYMEARCRERGQQNCPHYPEYDRR